MLDMFHILEQANSGNMHVFFSLLQIYSSFIQVWYQKLTTLQTAFSPWAVKETCSCHSCLVPGEGIDSWLGIHLLLHSGSQWLLFIYFIRRPRPSPRQGRRLGPPQVWNLFWSRRLRPWPPATPPAICFSRRSSLPFARPPSNAPACRAKAALPATGPSHLFFTAFKPAVCPPSNASEALPRQLSQLQAPALPRQLSQLQAPAICF